MADEKPPSVRRRRRKPPDTQPEQLTEQEIAARSSADPAGMRLSVDMTAYLTQSNIMAHRRVHFTHNEVALLVMEALLKRGMDRDMLGNARLVWVGSASGCPELYVIRQGIEA